MASREGEVGTDPVYGDYWRRKALLASGVPRFPVARWWRDDCLCEIERVYFDAVRDATSLLDFGAGDLRVKRKFLKAGFRGDYRTLDVGAEHAHEYANLDQVDRSFGAVLCLDVIEHLPLADGLRLLDRLVGVLEPNGVLVVQTPNARCVRHPLAWDMTHVHCYNLPDLWAYLACRCDHVEGRRVWFAPPRLGPLGAARSFVHKYVVTRVLGSDYADNIALIARRLPSDS